MKADRRKSKAAKPKTGSRIIDFLLIVISLTVLVFIGSFALKYTQGESAPPGQTPQNQSSVSISLRMQVLNGCGAPGVAGRFAKYLLDAGKPDFAIDVIDERNFSSFKQEKTTLIARRAGSPVAERLAMKLGLSPEQVTYKELEDNFLDIDYSLVVGSDYDRYLSRSIGKN
ncbi:MAG: LytR family transcriptional regulator [Candidatus Zixiibacteriota bacterium]|nr:MAG: LytR family transcriptional regulator [candidate division Zixibacteria bacterium]